MAVEESVDRTAQVIMPESSSFPLITLLTDFGSRDAYVGQVKGAILSICPDVRLVDLTHEIPPGNLQSAALVWCDAVGVFPPGTIHLGVVDPGVGTARRAIAAEVGPWRFVGPDNGLLTGILQRWQLIRAVELTEQRWWRQEVSPVFHGRDIFGPVAAHWAAGRELTDFGPLIGSPLIELQMATAIEEENLVRGEVISIDRFGNLRTNIPATMVDGRPDEWKFELMGQIVRGLSYSFSDGGPDGLVVLIGSHGNLEIAVNQGNAADRLGATIGAPVTARYRE